MKEADTIEASSTQREKEIHNKLCLQKEEVIRKP
jgi:hypothetical protein